MALDIKPTRSELINLKRRIKQTSSGYNLLKMKRDGLFFEFRTLLAEMIAAKEELVGTYRDALKSIALASSIEGASQRVQEDTLKFARIMEGLGAELLRSVMTLIAFTPILWGLSKSITVLPWIGEVSHALVWVAIISALGVLF